jgi:hypothetical protein
MARYVSPGTLQYITDSTITDFVFDSGLLDGETRDEACNVNNYSETSFRFFDLVLLLSRKNKRYVFK